MRGVFRYLGCWERVESDGDEEPPETVVREVRNAVNAYETVHGGTPHRQVFEVNYSDHVYRARVDRDGETRYYRAPDASAVRRTALGFGRLVGDVADSVERIREGPATVTARTTVFSAFAFLLVVVLVGAMGFGVGSPGENGTNATDAADGAVSNASTDILGDSFVFNEVRAERLVFEEANEVRGEHGVGETERVGALSESATVHAGNMAENEYVGHVTPAGEDVGGRYSGSCDTTGNTRKYSENAAAVDFKEPLDGWNGTELDSEEDIAEFVVKAWLNSSEHRENLLEPQNEGMGVGVRLQDGKVFVVQALCGSASD